MYRGKERRTPKIRLFNQGSAMTPMLKGDKFIMLVELGKLLQEMAGISRDPRGLVLHQPCVYANAHHGTQ